jgi:hypothetical protein
MKLVLPLSLLLCAAPAVGADEAVDRLTAALLGETPILTDLRALTDGIGGRPTGSEANRRAVDWGVATFRAAGVSASREKFDMPKAWSDAGSSARITGDATFTAKVVANPFSVPHKAGASIPLLRAGLGEPADFERLGASAKGAFLLVSTHELMDIEGLFREYMEAAAVEQRAIAAGARGIVWMASRPHALLYRHNAARGAANQLVLVTMAREDAQRAERLLQDGRRLGLDASVAIEGGTPYTAENVIGEIKGASLPDEVVLIGAHLDSWDLGTGALDNGCNVALVIDVARQMQRLGLKPKRTIRFVLWNGEEQDLNGSWAYAKAHRAELDKHAMAASFDTGTGRIVGFYTNGRSELIPAIDTALAPVAGLGPFTQTADAMTGTDHFDFLLEGVPALVANQESLNYGPNYHAASDTYDKVDARLLKTNAAIAAALAWGFANADRAFPRLSRAEVENVVETAPSLREQMEAFGSYATFKAGQRGRQP